MQETRTTNSEETPLLPSTEVKKSRTPLPKLQISILLLMQLAEPISSLSIYPFINQLIREIGITGGDETKVGYYAGVIESIFFVTQAITVLRWSQLSDRIGRKPVLLIGLSGLCISMLCFGLSRTFVTLIISRCICGVLNGNSGVMKSMMGELTDSTNMAQAFAFIPIVWCVGATIGPSMGGGLAHPHERFPGLFPGAFWKEYPYFLPCAAAAAFAAFAFLLVVFFLKDTLPRKSRAKASLESGDSITNESARDAIIPLRSLFIPSILIPVANYGILALTDMCILALQPLFYSTPIEHGGLSFAPSTIGSWTAVYGFVNGIFQLTFFAHIVGRFGPKRTFRCCVCLFLPVIALFPIMTLVVQMRGVDAITWVLLTCQMILMVMMNTAFGCIFMFVTTSAPTKRSLGAINGMGQTCASLARAFGPATATSLFAASKQFNLLGGNAVYVCLALLACTLMHISSRLPERLPPKAGEE
ncbi:MFS general substrate transporter [Hygrophoropsis aurantiaca]|uniref:MFS general substrate transporter n=1 Tax=Hygrophoropsis aurantiaca TaxID=72124 RepID=A0ACB8AQR5_9AGAM|nr:MFS general substrate transporter [Hygrophoropsis aurantiaca]